MREVTWSQNRISRVICLQQQSPTTHQLDLILSHPTVCMQNTPQLVGDYRERVQHFHVGLLRHVVGGPLPVVGDPLGVVGNRLLWCLKNLITWLNEALSM